MTMAVTDALARGQQAVLCASTGNTSASAAAYAAARRHDLRRAVPAGQDRHGQARPGRHARREDHAGRGQLRRLPGTGPQDHRRVPDDRAGQLGQPGADRGPEDRGVRDLRRPRQRARRPLLPVGNAGNITAYWQGYSEYFARRPDRRSAPDARLPGSRRRAAGARRTRSRTRRPSPPPSGSVRPRPGTARSPRRTSPAARSARPPTRRSSRPTGCSPPPRRLRRAGVGSQRRRPARGRARTDGCRPGLLVVCTVTGNGLKDPGHRAARHAGRRAHSVSIPLPWRRRSSLV